MNKMLPDLVDLSGYDIPPTEHRKLSGRAQFPLGIVNRLFETGSSQAFKQIILNKAGNDTIDRLKSGIRCRARTILESDKSGESAALLCRMVLACHLQDAKVSCSSNQQSDFVDKIMCRLRPHPDGFHLITDEPMLVEAVEEEL